MASQHLVGSTALCAVLVVLAGCTVGPNYSAPQTPVPGSFVPPTAQNVASQPVAEPVDAAWWNAFQDPELTSLESRVASANLDVATATIRIAESRTQQTIVDAAALPTLNGDASATGERVSSRGVFSLFASGNKNGGNSISSSGFSLSPFPIYQYGFDASWEPDLWGKVRRQAEEARANTAEAEDERRDALVSAFAEVARDYIALRGTQQNLITDRQDEQLGEQYVSLTRQRVAAGLSPDVDLDDATAELYEIQAAIPPLEDQQTQMINRLSYLLGETPGALASELITAKPIPPVPARVPVGLPSELAQRRPDIREAEQKLHAATATIGEAKADFYPSISLTGSFDLQALKLKDLGSWGARTYAVGPALSLPIFEGGKLRATLKMAQQDQQEAAIKYQRTVLSAWHEIDDALASYRDEQRRLDRLQHEVDMRNKTVSLDTDRYQRGLASELEVVTAERDALTAQADLWASTANVSADLVALYKALGGGWEGAYPGK